MLRWLFRRNKNKEEDEQSHGSEPDEEVVSKASAKKTARETDCSSESDHEKKQKKDIKKRHIKKCKHTYTSSSESDNCDCHHSDSESLRRSGVKQRVCFTC